MILTRSRQDTLIGLRNTIKRQESEVKLLGIVSNFVYPHHWKSYKAISKDERVKISFGIYPRILKFLYCTAEITIIAKLPKKVLELIRKLELQHLKIHRHCFTGTSSEVVEWISALPNCYFGLTEAVCFEP